MAFVKFDRKNGHPSIEVIGASGSEKAFIAEWLDSHKNSQFQPRFVFEDMGEGKIGFGWRSFLRPQMLEERKYSYGADINLPDGSELLGDGIFYDYLERKGIASYRLGNKENRVFFKTQGAGDWFFVIMVSLSMRHVYVVRLKDDEIIQCDLHGDMDMYKLIELEKSIGV